MGVMHSARTVALLVVFTIATFFVHRALRRIYYHRCDFDIIQVLFFRNSHMCTLLAGVINAIEGEYVTLMRGLYSVVWR